MLQQQCRNCRNFGQGDVVVVVVEIFVTVVVVAPTIIGVVVV